MPLTHVNKINAPKTCKSLQKLLQTFSISILLQPITLVKCTKCIITYYIFIARTDHRSNDFQNSQEGENIMNDVTQLAGVK